MSAERIVHVLIAMGNFYHDKIHVFCLIAALTGIYGYIEDA